MVNGFPFGDWQATVKERLAEEERRALEGVERDLARRMATPESKAWLQTAEGKAWQVETGWTPDWRGRVEQELAKRAADYVTI